MNTRAWPPFGSRRGRRRTRAIPALLLAAAACRVPAPPPRPAWGVVPVIGTGFRAAHPDRGPWVEAARRAIAYARVEAYTGFGYLARPGSAPDPFDAAVAHRIGELFIPGRRLVAFLDIIPPAEGLPALEIARGWQEACADAGAVAYQLARAQVRWVLFGDEPNGTGDPDWASHYMERLRRGYEAIHRVAPEAVVIAGNVGGDPKALRALYREGLKRAADAVGCHPRPVEPDEGIALSDVRAAARIVLEEDGPRRPLLFGRGWGPGEGPAAFSRLRHDIPIPAEEVLAIRRTLIEGLHRLRSLRSPILGAFYHPFNDSYHEERDGTMRFRNGGLADLRANAKDDLLDLFPGDRPSLANPGFELLAMRPGPGIPGWQVTGDAGAVEGAAHAGRRFARVGPGASIAQRTPPGSARTGTGYELRVFLATGAEAAEADLSIAFLDEDGRTLARRTRTVSPPPVWAPCALRARAPRGAHRIEVGIAASHGGGGAVRADDALLYEGPPPGRLASASILVRNERGGSVGGAEVHVLGTLERAFTDATGAALLYGIEPGAWDLACSAAGFRTETIRDQILRADRRRPIHFVLARQDPRLPARFEARPTGEAGRVLIRWDPSPELPFGLLRESAEGSVRIPLKPEHLEAGSYADAGLKDGRLYLYRPVLFPGRPGEEVRGPARGAVPLARAAPGTGGPSPHSTGRSGTPRSGSSPPSA